MNYGPPTMQRLVERMRQINCEISDNPTAQEAADELNSALASQAVCCTATVNGKPVLLKFFSMWEHVYQQKWEWPAYLTRERTARD